VPSQPQVSPQLFLALQSTSSMHCNVLLQLPLAGENALPTVMAWHGVYARYRHAYRLAWPAKLQHRITEVPLASNARKYAGQGVVAGTVAVLAVPDSTG
jgi:hypothetical protein